MLSDLVLRPRDSGQRSRRTDGEGGVEQWADVAAHNFAMVVDLLVVLSPASRRRKRIPQIPILRSVGNTASSALASYLGAVPRRHFGSVPTHRQPKTVVLASMVVDIHRTANRRALRIEEGGCPLHSGGHNMQCGPPELNPCDHKMQAYPESSGYPH